MPKAKTRKSAAKRIKVTGTGKVLVRHSGYSHLLTKKSARRKRALQAPGPLHPTQKKQVKRMVPHGGIK